MPGRRFASDPERISLFRVRMDDDAGETGGHKGLTKPCYSRGSRYSPTASIRRERSVAGNLD
jgi:hypothetical protein